MLKEIGLCHDPEKGGSSNLCQTSRKEERAGKKLKGKYCVNEKTIGDFIHQLI
jgi:hypothetical protein